MVALYRRGEPDHPIAIRQVHRIDRELLGPEATECFTSRVQLPAQHHPEVIGRVGRLRPFDAEVADVIVGRLDEVDGPFDEPGIRIIRNRIGPGRRLVLPPELVREDQARTPGERRCVRDLVPQSLLLTDRLTLPFPEADLAVIVIV